MSVQLTLQPPNILSLWSIGNRGGGNRIRTASPAMFVLLPSCYPQHQISFPPQLSLTSVCGCSPNLLIELSLSPLSSTLVAIVSVSDSGVASCIPSAFVVWTISHLLLPIASLHADVAALCKGGQRSVVVKGSSPHPQKTILFPLYSLTRLQAPMK
eukprot:EG_transcript_16213